jgi:hypothetical protein
MAIKGKSNFIYYDDSGASWGVQKTTEWGKNGASGYEEVTSLNKYKPLPRRYRQRYVNAVAFVSGVTIHRRFECGKPSAAAYKDGATFSYDGLSWVVIGSIVGERRYTFTAANTGAIT